tara:strand:+ start:130 stop:654 length:525 start_codon:yes stop_codon:yes gene_type:complete
VKKIKLFFITLILSNYTSYSYTQNLAYANMDNIIKTSEAGKKIIIYFSDKNNNLINQLNDKKKVIKEKEKSLLAQKNILEQNQYLKKIEEIKKEIDEFNIEHNKKIGQIQNEKNEVSKSFQIEINKILKEFAENNNIDIIFSSNQMLIGKSSLDVTDDLLEVVNSKIKNFKISK